MGETDSFGKQQEVRVVFLKIFYVGNLLGGDRRNREVVIVVKESLRDHEGRISACENSVMNEEDVDQDPKRELSGSELKKSNTKPKGFLYPHSTGICNF